MRNKPHEITCRAKLGPYLIPASLKLLDSPIQHKNEIKLHKKAKPVKILATAKKHTLLEQQVTPNSNGIKHITPKPSANTAKAREDLPIDPQDFSRKRLK